MEFSNRWRDLFLVLAFFGTWFPFALHVPSLTPFLLSPSVGFNVAITISQSNLRVVPDHHLTNVCSRIPFFTVL